MKGKPLVWNEELFHQTIKCVTKDDLIEKLKEGMNVDELNQLELNHDYPLNKNMFGVQIEFGMLRVQRVSLNEILELLKKFVAVGFHRGKYEFEPITNFEAIKEVAFKWGLEKPNEEAVKGYILNQELVEFVNGDDLSYLRIKYKDNPENIFYVYKFYCTDIKGETYLVIEKNI